MKTGFTLIELLVVVLIIGILAAVALPQYEVAVRKARVARVLPLFRSIVSAQEVYYLANGTYTADLDALDVAIKYTSRNVSDTGSWVYQGTPVDVLHVSPTSAAVFWDGPGMVIDFFSTWQRCYPHADQVGKTGEKVCASLGTKTGGMSSSGTPMYQMR